MEEVIDVFMRTCIFKSLPSETGMTPSWALRAHLAEAVLERLHMFTGVRVWTIDGDDEPRHHGAIAIGSALDFARRSREVADQHAASGVYVLIDDDQLPIGRDWVRDGVAALRARPDYAMLSSWSVNGEVPYTFVRSSGFEVEVGEAVRRSASFVRMPPDVFDADSSGTPCFVRKGTFIDLPDGSAPEYDQVLSKHLVAGGQKIGFLSNVRHNHLGYGYSQVVAGHWSA